MDSRVTATGWRKSSRSSGNGGNCVEVGQANRDVAVRDTKDRQGPVLAFTPHAWRAYTAKLRNS